MNKILTVIVKDINGNAIEGAQIYVADKIELGNKTTGLNGSVSFTLPKYAILEIRIRKNKYRAIQSSGLNFSKDATLTFIMQTNKVII